MVDSGMVAKPTKSSSPTRLLREMERLEAQAASIQARRLVLADELEAAAKRLRGEDPEPQPARTIRRRKRHKKIARQKQQERAAQAAAAAADDGLPTWTSAIHDIVMRGPKGLTYGEVKNAMRTTPLGPTLERTDKAFYGGLAKLTKSGRVMRHNGKFFTPQALKSFLAGVQMGLFEDVPAGPESGQKSPTRDAILNYLQEHPKGAPIATLFEMLERDTGQELSDKNSKTIVYNLIARLIKRGVLTKDTKGIIRAAQVAANNDEAPHALAGRASH